MLNEMPLMAQEVMVEKFQFVEQQGHSQAAKCSLALTVLWIFYTSS